MQVSLRAPPYEYHPTGSADAEQRPDSTARRAAGGEQRAETSGRRAAGGEQRTESTGPSMSPHEHHPTRTARRVVLVGWCS